jgi:hypothetical protein
MRRYTLARKQMYWESHVTTARAAAARRDAR